MNAFRYSVEVKKLLGGEFTKHELAEAMRLCSEGKTVAECAAILQQKRDSKK